jgi:hypothetical protein
VTAKVACQAVQGREAVPVFEFRRRRLVVADLLVVVEADVVQGHAGQVELLRQERPDRRLAGPDGADQDDLRVHGRPP